MTTIDLIFIWFYILTGATIITTAAGLSFGTAVYATLMFTLKILIPVSVICIVASLWRRIRSSPFKISINR